MLQNNSLLEQYNKVRVLMKMLKTYRKDNSTGSIVNTLYTQDLDAQIAEPSKSTYYSAPMPTLKRMSQKIQLNTPNSRTSKRLGSGINKENS